MDANTSYALMQNVYQRHLIEYININQFLDSEKKIALWQWEHKKYLGNC